MCDYLCGIVFSEFLATNLEVPGSIPIARSPSLATSHYNQCVLFYILVARSLAQCFRGEFQRSRSLALPHFPPPMSLIPDPHPSHSTTIITTITTQQHRGSEIRGDSKAILQFKNLLYPVDSTYFRTSSTDIQELFISTRAAVRCANELNSDSRSRCWSLRVD
uniref:Uncharacterized protein n=1 Tax=Timema poppense TaxID=170557 RepID=A0A7R9D1H3_TIMPO|nr:unnamed protein product [Timema poppensis]